MLSFPFKLSLPCNHIPLYLTPALQHVRKDQAEDKASSELAKFRNIWEDVLNPYSTRGEIPLITTEKGLPINNNRKARWAERARRNYT